MANNFRKWKMSRQESLKPNDCIAIKVVAKIGWGHDWAAYMGHSDWSDEKVADEGDKIEEIAARKLFPGVPNELYYRN